MTARRFVDTNILLYSISRDAAEAVKRERAIALLSGHDLGLSTQVLQEFYVQATRPTRTHPLPHGLAVGFIQTWTRFPVQEVSLSIVQAAFDIRARHGFSYWDSAIIAAAQALGCEELLTEDMADGQQVGDVVIRNPFVTT